MSEHQTFGNLAVQRRSIPTIYNGTRFRSKLEADYARTFDALGIPWQYEREAQYFGDVFYLPDFWLPKSRQFVEVKGVFEPDDCRKIRALLANVQPRPFTHDECPDIPLVACIPNGHFYGWQRPGHRNESWLDFLTKRAIPVGLLRCMACNGWWFADIDWSWRCQCCGAYDGRRQLADHLESPFSPFPHLLAPRD